MDNVLIIKLGALGDVVRTTAILNVIEGHVVWITKPGAVPLLEGIDSIDLLTSNVEDVAGKHFDVVYNLDDDMEGCSILERVSFDRLHGFYENGGKILPMPGAEGWWEMSLNGPEDRDSRKMANRRTFQHFLFRNCGKEFNGEDYVFGYAPEKVHDNVIGIEASAGPRWPLKVWPYYSELKSRLEMEGFRVKFFSVREDIRDYIRDINSCRVVVSGDTLAMHIALALKKKVVAIFGPTSPYEIEMYGRGEKLFNVWDCSGCFKKVVCDISPNCMEALPVGRVFDSVKRLAGNSLKS